MKYRPIFITATNTDIGKTYATCKLIEEFSEQGLHVGVFKPIETGVVDIPVDGKLLLQTAQKTNPYLKDFTCKDIVPIQYKLPAAPYVAKGDEHIGIKSLHVAFDKIASVSDIVLIEGAGGLMVPIAKDFYMYDFIREFNAITLLVTHANLGCINDTLLNINLLKSLHVEHEWCVNFRGNKKDFNETTLPFYKKIISLQDDIKLLSQNLLKSVK
jgi:dethiobiotin synthetase